MSNFGFGYAHDLRETSVSVGSKKEEAWSMDPCEEETSATPAISFFLNDVVFDELLLKNVSGHSLPVYNYMHLPLKDCIKDLGDHLFKGYDYALVLDSDSREVKLYLSSEGCVCVFLVQGLFHNANGVIPIRYRKKISLVGKKHRDEASKGDSSLPLYEILSGLHNSQNVRSVKNRGI